MIIVFLLIDESDTCIESVSFNYKSLHSYWAPLLIHSTIEITVILLAQGNIVPSSPIYITYSEMPSII